MAEIIKKKRGRKPKNSNVVKIEPIIKPDYNSEDEDIILHLPINPINDEINIKEEMNVFMASGETYTEKTEMTNYETSIVETESKAFQVNPAHTNTIRTHVLKIGPNTKCWWCKNSFNNDIVELPEDFWDNKFHCVGYFCSYNCASAYNLDLNDNFTSKRCSLLHLMCSRITGKNDRIISAPHWLMLIDFGGVMTIEEFRKNSIVNRKEWILLKPPLISRQIQIEESYKLHKVKSVPIDALNKLYSEVDSEYKIKRSKPLESTQMNLANTMGLIRKPKKKVKIV
jgi:hypothetical protein